MSASDFATCPLGHTQIHFIFEFTDDVGTRVTSKVYGGPAREHDSGVSLLACAECGITFISFENTGSDHT